MNLRQGVREVGLLVNSGEWKQLYLLPKITAPLPVFPVAFNPQWKHLTGLRLAVRDFSIPGSVDVLLSGRSGTPLALETHFGWVLSDKAHPEYPGEPMFSCFSSVSQFRNTHIVQNMYVQSTLENNSRLRRCCTVITSRPQ